MCLFFFSSRRRHTRCGRDWSSDVCSSDLPKIVPEKRLGTAYSLIFWVQNWGLMGVPLLIGWVLEKYCITGQTMRDGMLVNTYDYTLPMMIFTTFGVLALIFAFLLKAEDKKKGYGLESPNIQH